jgi:hypothetical protein
VIVDVDRGARRNGVAVKDLGGVAPGQKLRVGFDRVHQIEHLLRRVADEHGFFYDRQLFFSRRTRPESRAGRMGTTRRLP